MQANLGVLYRLIGGFSFGSFYISYKKIKGWSWESYWIEGGIFSWLFVPPFAAYLIILNFSGIIDEASNFTIFYTYIFDLLWGMGGLTYGLGVKYLGVSLGSSIILGLCAVFGAIIPSIYYEFFSKESKDTISMMAGSQWGQLVLLGLLVGIIGIVLCGKAGQMKEKDLGKRQRDTVNSEFRIGLGLLVAVIPGVLSACFAFGIDAVKVMANQANEIWKAANPFRGEFLFQNNVTYVIILWGGLTTNFIWWMLLDFHNKSFGDYTNNNVPLLKNYAFSALRRNNLVFAILFRWYGWKSSR